MEKNNTLDVQPLEDRYLKRVFEMEPGDADYYDWLEVVTRPDWLRYGLFLDSKFAGFLGVHKVNPETASIHINVKRHTLTPIQTRRVVINTGIFLFNNGTELLETSHFLSNKPACRLASACGMSIDHLLVRDKTPHCCHSLMKSIYLSDPKRWEI